jgi:hypothetical protein
MTLPSFIETVTENDIFQAQTLKRCSSVIYFILSPEINFEISFNSAHHVHYIASPTKPHKVVQRTNLESTFGTRLKGTHSQ